MNSILDKETVKRVEKILKDFDPNLDVVILEQTSRTANDAATALGCNVGAIVKSLLFKIGDKFCLSYVNFYIANGSIIAPSYGIKTDDEVKERLQSYFPSREINMVPISSIAQGGGGIHCITQQQPK